MLQTAGQKSMPRLAVNTVVNITIKFLTEKLAVKFFPFRLEGYPNLLSNFLLIFFLHRINPFGHLCSEEYLALRLWLCGDSVVPQTHSFLPAPLDLTVPAV